MSQPTTSIGFSPTTPAAPAGYVNTVPQTDSGTPLQKLSEYVASVGGVSVKTANYTAAAGDNGTLLVFNSASAVTLTLPASPPMAIWKMAVQNVGAGVLTIARNGLLIDTAAANLTLVQNAGVEIFTDGTNYFSERGTASAATIISGAGITIFGSELTAAGSKGFLPIPFAGTITGWTLLADQSGSASITVKKSTFAAFPATASIVASAPPTLSSQQSASSTTLTGWTVAVAAGDVLEFVLASATTVTRLTLELQITRS